MILIYQERQRMKDLGTMSGTGEIHISLNPRMLDEMIKEINKITKQTLEK